jgi:uncharacterized membrane protein required for colicin V production
MSTYDVIILVVLCAFGLRSLMKGLIGEIMGIIGLIVGFLCGRLFGHTVGVTLFGAKNPWLADPAGYMIVFILVIIAARILSRILKISVKKTPIRWLDKAGGFATGFIIGATILSLGLLALKSFDVNARKMHFKSPASAVFQQSTLASALPKYTVCLFLGDMMKTCKMLDQQPPAPAPVPAKKK